MSFIINNQKKARRNLLYKGIFSKTNQLLTKPRGNMEK